MFIKKLHIELSVAEKITRKHGVYRHEIEATLFEGGPIFFRSRENKYVAIGLKERYITIVFSYKQNIAVIKTAYPSSDWQIKLYRRKRSKK